MPFTLTCDRCKEDFTRSAGQGRPGGIFCSRRCYWDSTRRSYAPRTCAGCGGTFDPRKEGRKSHLDRDFCTRDCYNETRRGTLTRWLSSQRDGGCWLWPYGLNKDGYGVTTKNGKQALVHRAAYETLVGRIPIGLQIDHECHNGDPGCLGGKCAHRRCANPAHLRPSDGKGNTLRGKTAAAGNAAKNRCPQGHEYDYVSPSGARGCRTCRTEATARYRARSLSGS